MVNIAPRALSSSLNVPTMISSLGALLLAINFAFQPERFNSISIVFLSVTTLLLLTLLPLFPSLLWCPYLLIFIFTVIKDENHLITLIFAAPVALSILSYREKYIETIVSSIFLWYFGSIDFTGPKFVPHDALASFIWGSLLSIFAILGFLLSISNKKREQILQEWHEDVEHRRTIIAETLHDSVCASLTAAIFRIETINQSEIFETEIQQDLDKVAQDVRVSMGQIRQLLQLIKMNSQEYATLQDIQLVPLLIKASNNLKSLGFSVSLNIDGKGDVAEARSLKAFKIITDELITNIIKYADKSAPVIIELSESESSLQLDLKNFSKNVIERGELSSELGISKIVHTLSDLKGSLIVNTEGRLWHSVVILPKEK